tara:strand:+ start:60 stop:305 length:246 start_codon:yes stop_codon:yes gene_type:complete
MENLIGVEDLTKYSDQELMLRVLNDEYFYDLIKKRDWLYTEVDDQFIYTDQQFKELEKAVEEIHARVWPQPTHIANGFYVE